MRVFKYPRRRCVWLSFALAAAAAAVGKVGAIEWSSSTSSTSSPDTLAIANVGELVTVSLACPAWLLLCRAFSPCWTCCCRIRVNYFY